MKACLFSAIAEGKVSFVCKKGCRFDILECKEDIVDSRHQLR
jgi:hypothetical protein